MKYNPTIHKRRSIRLKGYDYSQAGMYFITICCDARICRFGHIENGEMILNEFGIIAYEEWVKLAERFDNFDLDVFQIMPNHMHGIISLAHQSVCPSLANPPQAPVWASLADAPQAPVRASLADAPDAPDAPDTPDTPDAPDTPDIPLTDAPPEDDLPIIKEPAVRAGASPAPTDTTTPIASTIATAPTISDIVGAYKSLVANRCLEIYKSRNKIMGRLWQRNYYEHIMRDERAYYNISNYIINNPAKWEADKFHK